MTPFSRPFDVERLAALITARSARWYRACLRITARPALAEEAVQEALLKAWRHRESFRGEAEVDTWVHRIAVHAAIDLMRREPAIVPVELPETGTRRDERAHELGRDLNLAMQALSPLERTVFVLKHHEQWSLAEIAEQLGCSVDSVKQGLFRGVRKLRSALADWRGEE
ncbi:MAG: RNA polymerase sigma factor [Xanthomonadales bacterium]|jgi:RNA polymerase sigma-70 factor (ECF subfamily)|nr:RNA polymerase sigma factor [Xanthomonadales bacterium]